jgi:ATP-dependent Lon protease
MKVLAAHRAALTTIILPKRNEQDLEELPTEVRNAMTFIPADRIDGAIATALDSEKPLNQGDSEATMKNQAGHEACAPRPTPVACQG